MYTVTVTSTSGNAVWFDNIGQPLKPAQVASKQWTDEELVNLAIGASQLHHWSIRVDRPEWGSSPTYRRHKNNWHSMCIVNFNEKEYRAIRKYAKSFGKDVHLGRRENGNADSNVAMGSYEDSSCWYQFRKQEDYEAFCKFLDDFPKRDRVMKIQNLNSEAKKLLVNANSYVMEASEGTFLFYHSGAVSKADETLIALACGGAPITSRSGKPSR